VGTLKAWCRARIDRLVLDPAGFADAWDWKTTTDVSPDTLQRTIIDHGYDIQAAFYLRGLRKLLPEYEGRFSFNFVFVETSAPYAVRRVVLRESFNGVADGDVHRAIPLWARCLSRNAWPDYSEQTLHLEAPGYYAFKRGNVFGSFGEEAA